jgi:hypothetical protein
MNSASNIAEKTSGLFHDNAAEQARVYNQAVLLNSLIRNMVQGQHEQADDVNTRLDVSSSNESCTTRDTRVKSRSDTFD